MTTFCTSPQILLQDYYLITDEIDQIILDFRAPPPSPTGSSRRTSFVANDGVLSEYLESTLKVPDLILPNKIFPRQKPFKGIPVIDFHDFKTPPENSLILRINESFEEIGCFQVVNHGISPELINTVMRRALRIFRLSLEKKNMAVRSPEVPFGFEEVIGDQKEIIGEMCEEFVWGKSCGFNEKMEGILPIKYSKFSTKMESLARSVEKVAEDIMSIIMKDEGGSLNGESKDMMNDSICHLYKHPHDASYDQCINSLRYDVIRMMIRGSDYSHALSFHICDGSSEFHVYSKKGWTSFIPLTNALVVTSGDQIQTWSVGRYKHVIAKPIYTNKNKDCISMALRFSAPRNITSIHDQHMVKSRIISLRSQALLAIFLTFACQFVLYVYNILKHYS